VLTEIAQAAPAGGPEWRTWVPVASAAIAVLALVVAFSNRTIARKALTLSERQEERRVARLELSYNEAVSWRLAGNAWRWIGVDILAVNPTDRDGSIISAELHVTYTTSAGVGAVVKLAHDAASPTRGGREPLRLPLHISANGAVRGWLGFKLPDDLVGPEAIQRYDATVRDSRGPIETMQLGVLKECRDDPTT
jgi:hypothetical protein